MHFFAGLILLLCGKQLRAHEEMCTDHMLEIGSISKTFLLKALEMNEEEAGEKNGIRTKSRAKIHFWLEVRLHLAIS